MTGSFTLRKMDCLVHIIILPVSEQRPAEDFFLKVRRVLDLRSYHFEVKFHT
jgi:hypothetical protein